MKKKILMIPGPVEISPDVQKKFSQPSVPHRSQEFSEILKEINENLQYVFQTKNDVFIFTSSGTGAMCATLDNLVNPNDEILCLVNGKFSQRWAEIAEFRHAKIHKIQAEIGETIQPKTLKNYLNKHKNIKFVTMAQCETSTGAVNDVQKLCRIIENYGAISVVDSISGIGAMECKQDEWGIDVLICSSQKGLATPAGLSFLSASQKAWEIHKLCQNPSYYFNWDKYKNAKNSTPFTPAINNILALNESLKQIKKQGLDNFIEKHTKLSSLLRKEIKNLGLEILASGNSCTSVYVPDNFSAREIIRILNEKYNVIVAGGQEELKDKIIRIGTIGNLTDKDIYKLVNALKKIIHS